MYKQYQEKEEYSEEELACLLGDDGPDVKGAADDNFDYNAPELQDLYDDDIDYGGIVTGGCS